MVWEWVDFSLISTPLWGTPMPDEDAQWQSLIGGLRDGGPRSTPETLSPGGDAVLRAFERAWVRGEVPALADFLPEVSASPERLLLLRELIHIDLEFRTRGGQPVDINSYQEAHPELFAN